MEIESEAELYNKANKLIEDIYKFKSEYATDLSLIDTIIEYSTVSSIPLQEIGNTLADHKDFVKIFKNQLTKEKYFKEENTVDYGEYEDEEW
jgi:hypothetical protein